MNNVKKYKNECIKKIRSSEKMFRFITDDEISKLYSEWSELKYQAGWVIINDENTIKDFNEWCFKSPFSLLIEKK